MIERLNWQARIAPSEGGFRPDFVRLQLYRPSAPGYYEVLSATDLVIETVAEGSYVAGNGIALTPAALLAIREAIDDWQGAPKSNAEAENKVLREVLDVERRRVDRVLES